MQNDRHEDDEVERNRRKRNPVLGAVASAVPLKFLYERVPGVAGVHGMGLPFRW